MLRSLRVSIAFVILIVAGAYLVEISFSNTSTAVSTTPEPQTAAAIVPLASTTTVASSSSAVATTTRKSLKAAAATSSIVKVSAKNTATSSANKVVRIQNPYPTPPLSFDTINTSVRNALVNIFCVPKSHGTLRPISGSGVIIDPRGIILTNAHVAQYVLLSEDPRIDLSCTVRTSSPAKGSWNVSVLSIPPIWVSAHASEINTEHPMGSGEHDYSLLAIDTSHGDAPSLFPYLPYDTREAVGFVGDQVLGAGYAAELVGGIQAEQNLYAITSVSSVQQLLTFNSSVDLFSIGNVIEAQGGSSGGAVANQWGKLIGIITTTSAGATTGNRDLRALSLSYIDRDMQAQYGASLSVFLQGDIASKVSDFNTNQLPSLINSYLPSLSK